MGFQGLFQLEYLEQFKLINGYKCIVGKFAARPLLLFEFHVLLLFFVGVWRWLLIGVDTLEVKQATSNET